MAAHNYVLIVVRNLQEPLDDYCHHVLKKQGYRLETILAGQDPTPIMEARPPVAACFQFDYPDFEGLASLREAKQASPSVPLLMITQAHSEHLAVWAFRARVWDYFVQPLDVERFLEVMAKLYNVRVLAKASSPAPGVTSISQTPQIATVTSARDVVEIKNCIPHEARLHCSAIGDEQGRLQRALSLIDQNLHRKIAQAEVAELCDLSNFQFSRFFKRLTGITFQEYLLHRRINEAMRLLANPKVSITDICFTVGFRDHSYFTRTFQRYVGKPPSRYRLEATQSALQTSQRLLNAPGIGADHTSPLPTLSEQEKPFPS